MTRFEWQPATLRRTHDHYYVLDYGVGEMGGTSAARLTAWARTHGFKVTRTEDVRPKPLRVEHGI